MNDQSNKPPKELRIDITKDDLVGKPIVLSTPMTEEGPYRVKNPIDDDPYAVFGPGMFEECDDFEQATQICALFNSAYLAGVAAERARH